MNCWKIVPIFSDRLLTGNTGQGPARPELQVNVVCPFWVFLHQPSWWKSATTRGHASWCLTGLTFSGLESLTFGGNFKQSLERVRFPVKLQALTLGNLFNQSLEARRSGVRFFGINNFDLIGLHLNRTIQRTIFFSQLHGSINFLFLNASTSVR